MAARLCVRLDLNMQLPLIQNPVLCSALLYEGPCDIALTLALGKGMAKPPKVYSY